MEQHGILEHISVPESLNENMGNDRYLRVLAKACGEPHIHHLLLSFPVSCEDPLTWLNQIQDGRQFQYYWEKPQASTALAAFGSEMEISANGNKRFSAIEKALSKAEQQIFHFGISPDEPDPEAYFLGGFSFFDELESSVWEGYQPASFVLPEYLLRTIENESTVTIAVKIDTDESEESLHKKITRKLGWIHSIGNKNKSAASTTEEVSQDDAALPPLTDEHQNWIKMVTDARQKIVNGDFKKVVIGRQLQLDISPQTDPFSVLRRLRKRYPRCTTFLVQPPNAAAFVGCSPELLLSVENQSIHTEALAGSIARGSSSQQDEQLESRLMESIKDHEEHTFVVKDIKKLLNPFVEDLHAADQPLIKKLANVQHLYSPIRGHLHPDCSLFPVLSQLHPTPAVGGTPRDEALNYIQQRERFARGWFAGPVGWLTTAGRAEFSVAIRSGLIDSKEARLFAGCGIVADSDPETEWQETNLKFMPMLSALNYD